MTVASDHDDIRTLLAGYAFALDLGEADEFADCFTSDGSFEIVGLPAGHPLRAASKGTTP